MWVGFGLGVLLVYLIWVLVNSLIMEFFKEMQNGFEGNGGFKKKDSGFIERGNRNLYRERERERTKARQ